MAETSEVALSLDNVRREYGPVVAVENATFQVKRGGIVSLLGPSGCGKTTTLRLIAGFEDPDQGTVTIAGRNMAGLRPYERNVGLLFQDYALFPHMTVASNISYGLKHRGFEKAKIPDRVGEMLKLVKLEGYDSRYPRQLSGGQQQRVALARAMAIQPEVVLLDEPLSALDAKLRDQLRVELKQILRAADATTIVVTHDQEEAMSLSDFIIVMNNGKIMQQGSPEEIYSSPQNKFVADFIGRSNWFQGQVTSSSKMRTIFDAGLDGLIHLTAAVQEGQNGYELGIRPERIVHLTPDLKTSDGKSVDNHLAGTLLSKQFLGADIHLWVELPSGKVVHVVEQNNGEPIAAEGEVLDIGFNARDCIVVKETN